MTKVHEHDLSSKERMYECSLCEKQFKWKSEMKRHELSHNPQYECKICCKKFSFLSALRRHEKTHERIEPVHCDECGGTFRDESLLKRHIKYAHNGETLNCTKCSAIFTSEAALQTHSKTHKENSERRYRCSSVGCKKSFNFPHHLKHHELTHTGVKQYFCVVCGKGFIQAHHLKTHLKGHEPDTWLSCDVADCQKRFSNQYALKRHISTHKNKKEQEPASPKNSLKSKGLVLCYTCGDLIPKTQITRHTIGCQTKEIIKTETDIINSTSPGEDSNSSFEMFDDIKDSDSFIASEIIKSDFINCKKSGCRTKEDGRPDENCLCANIATSPDNISLEDISPQPIEIKTEVVFYEKLNNEMNNLSFREKNGIAIEDIAVKNETMDFETCKNIFGGCLASDDGQPNEDCICAELSKKNKNKNTKKLSDCNNCLVKCEDYYKRDGSVEANGNNRGDQVIPFSCKDVLGNCIVSGDGTMGDECLCAKMYNNNKTREIEDITPFIYENMV